MALSLEGQSDAIVSAARQVLDALGLHAAGGLAPGMNLLESQRLAHQAKAPLLQLAGLLTSSETAWLGQSDEALIAQGQASAETAPVFARFMLPELPGLAGTLAASGARMLDVGTGVAALDVSFCQVFPALTVERVDVSPRCWSLRAVLSPPDVAERVVLRELDVAELTDKVR